jgi:hypothetical protein
MLIYGGGESQGFNNADILLKSSEDIAEVSKDKT